MKAKLFQSFYDKYTPKSGSMNSILIAVLNCTIKILTFSVIFDKITLKSCTIGCITYCFTIAVSINNIQKIFGCDLPILL